MFLESSFVQIPDLSHEQNLSCNGFLGNSCINPSSVFSNNFSGERVWWKQGCTPSPFTILEGFCVTQIVSGILKRNFVSLRQIESPKFREKWTFRLYIVKQKIRLNITSRYATIMKPGLIINIYKKGLLTHFRGNTAQK